MAVAVEDLLTPMGVIEPEFFPKDDEAALVRRLSQYRDLATDTAIADGLTGAALDAATRALAYHHAFLGAYHLRLVTENSASLTNQGSVGYASDQRAGLKTEADRWLAVYEALAAEAAGVAVEAVADASGWATIRRVR